MDTKRCTVCKKVLPATLEFFHHVKTCKNGLNSICKKCKCKRDKEYRENNREKERIRKAKYYEENKEKCQERNRNYRENNKEKERSRIRKWNEENAEHVKAHNRERKRKKYQRDPIHALKVRLRSRLRSAFIHFSKTGKQASSDEYGIDYSEIISFLGPCPGKLEDYHIDHIVPLSSFDFDDLEQIKKAFAPENHQWLTKEDNLKKGNKITALEAING